VRAGWRAASIAVITESAIPVMITSQGRLSGSITWPVAACRRGTYASHAPKPATDPATTAAPPTAAPFATMTSWTLRIVAPRELSMPRARSRRCAMTVNPATATRPMNTRPSTDAASAITAGLMPEPPVAGYDTTAADDRPRIPPRGASSRIDTCVGSGTCPGSTSANSSSRLLGFCTIPVTR
jgi:hypothetical protein